MGRDRRHRDGDDGRGQRLLAMRIRRRPEAARAVATAARFWGGAEDLPEAEPELRITDDPDAVPRSLGEPPLPGSEAVAGHYLAAIYDRAVGIAGALALANGLIEPDDLPGDATMPG